MNYVIMDLEWNQPMTEKRLVTKPVTLRGEIIQIGAVKLNENFMVEDRYKQLVTPQYYTKMHYRVAKLTGIKSDDLKSGLPFPAAWESFLSWCGEEFAFLTWGPDDIPMLRNNLILHGIDPSSIPAHYNVQVLFARQIAKENRQFSLSSAAEMVGETPEAAHDALNDAVSTALICRHLDMSEGLTHYADGKLAFATTNGCQSDAKHYDKKSDALNDPEIRCFIDEKSGETAQCGRWLSQKNDRYVTVAQTASGKEFFVRVRFRKNAEGRYRAGRSIYPLTEDHAALYASLKQRKHRPRHRKSKASLKPKMKATPAV
ncbi:MAG: exonuclease domain-containing protein [Clostridia bacterium]|nr:exonuclease domain-containing protein [Clostridia bacterium]